MKTWTEMEQENTRLTQRVLAIPGVELVTSTDPVALYGEKPRTPPRRLLFTRDWLAFSLDHDQGAAAQVFERRTGRKPEFIYQDIAGRLLWVGPVQKL